ncbi:hypothetical protein IJT93_09760 [bacterium]|nr:hypothetical protein [bacterium]
MNVKKFKKYAYASAFIALLSCSPAWAEPSETPEELQKSGPEYMRTEGIDSEEAYQEQSAEQEEIINNNISQDEVNIPIFDMRGDDGVLMSFRPSGITFLSPNRILVTDENNQQLHIFDIEGRRFRRVANPRSLSQPRYTGLSNIENNKFFAVGSHYHQNNNVRYVWARSVLHMYELRGEIFTDSSAEINYDPELAWRNTGHYGEMTENPLRVEGVACDPIDDIIYFGLSKPADENGKITVLTLPLSQVMEKKRKLKFENFDSDLLLGTDPLTEEPFVLTDICCVPERGLLFLLSSKSKDERRAGSSQIWFQANGSQNARLIADQIAPGNFASGLGVLQRGEAFDIGLVFDNNPELNDTPSRFMILKDIDI